MNEASKTNRVRGEDFLREYFSGSVLDIGCGADLVVAHAQPFDLVHGDAGAITEYLGRQSFDCVHSSHCLEHMRNVRQALRGWWELVKPGGVMIVVVPEEDLYEQGIWPSLFNPDHKATFRLERPTTWSPVSYDLRELVSNLPGAEVIEIKLQDQGYDYSLRRRGVGAPGRVLHDFSWFRKAAMRRLKLDLTKLDRVLDRIEQRLGKPIDQTTGDALAQLQAIVRKLPDAEHPSAVERRPN